MVGSKTGREKCGKILPYKAFNKQTGYVGWLYPSPWEHVIEGDSGGPVYAYVHNPDGSIKGVSALGINEGYTCILNVCTNYFLPIATIMEELGVTVLTTP